MLRREGLGGSAILRLAPQRRGPKPNHDPLAEQMRLLQLQTIAWPSAWRTRNSSSTFKKVSLLWGFRWQRSTATEHLMTAAVQSAPDLGIVSVRDALGVSRACLHGPAKPAPLGRSAAVAIPALIADVRRVRRRARPPARRTLSGPFSCGSLWHAAGRRRLLLFDTHSVPSFSFAKRVAGAPRPVRPSCLSETAVAGHGSRSALELGHYQLLGPAKWTYFYFYVILDAFSRYVVGWMIADREGQEMGPHARRSGCAQDSQPPACLRRQSVLGEPVQDLEVPARIPGSRPIHTACSGFLPGLLPLVQH